MTYRLTAASADRLIELVTAGQSVEDAAAALGTTGRTIYRRAKADEDLGARLKAAIKARDASRPLQGHGTAACYRRGCRCDFCRGANSRRCLRGSMLRRERAGLPPPNRRRGRPRGVYPGRPASIPTLAEAIEQAIARGEKTSAIMLRFSCDYPTVKTVRDAMDVAS